jgi:hypothetical protein
MSSYWDPLADVLPQAVRDAMSAACTSATHRGTGRPGEPVLMAGVRELLRHCMLRDEVNSLVRGHQLAVEEARQATDAVAATGRRERADEHNALARVWQLHGKTRGRKTVSREELHRALAPHEYEGEAIL